MSRNYSYSHKTMQNCHRCEKFYRMFHERQILATHLSDIVKKKHCLYNSSPDVYTTDTYVRLPESDGCYAVNSCENKLFSAFCTTHNQLQYDNDCNEISLCLNDCDAESTNHLTVDDKSFFVINLTENMTSNVILYNLVINVCGNVMLVLNIDGFIVCRSIVNINVYVAERANVDLIVMYQSLQVDLYSKCNIFLHVNEHAVINLMNYTFMHWNTISYERNTIRMTFDKCCFYIFGKGDCNFYSWSFGNGKFYLDVVVDQQHTHDFVNILHHFFLDDHSDIDVRQTPFLSLKGDGINCRHGVWQSNVEQLLNSHYLRLKLMDKRNAFLCFVRNLFMNMNCYNADNKMLFMRHFSARIRDYFNCYFVC